MMRSDFNRFSALTKDLLLEDIQGTDKYLITVAKTYNILQEYEMSGLTRTQHRHNKYNQDGNNNNINDIIARVIFAHTHIEDDAVVPGTDGSVLNNLSLRFFKYKKKGHIRNNCPSRK